MKNLNKEKRSSLQIAYEVTYTFYTQNGVEVIASGTRLKVLNAAGNSIELQSDNAGGNTVTINGSVSVDGQTMEAKWSTNGAQDSRPPRILIKSSGEGFSQSLPKPWVGTPAIESLVRMFGARASERENGD